MNEQKSKADFTVKELDINDDILKGASSCFTLKCR